MAILDISLSRRLSAWCKSQNKRATSRPLLPTKLSVVKAASRSPEGSLAATPSSRPLPAKCFLAMKPSRGTNLLFLTASFAPFYDRVQLRCEDKVPANGRFMTPKGAQGQRSPLNSPPSLRRSSAFSHISIIPPTSMHIPEHLMFPDFNIVTMTLHFYLARVIPPIK
jgi:hypothetical protein